MHFRFSRQAVGVFFTAVLLLGNMFETLPFLHHHEEQHACIQTELGNFYLEMDEHRHATEEDESVPHLRPFRMGEHHHHDFCALCHYVPSLQKTARASLSFFDVGPAVHLGGNPVAAAFYCHAHKPRGPPSSS